MNWKIGILLVGIIAVAVISGCLQLGPPPMVKIINAKLELGSLVLSLDANQSLENVRIDVVDEYGQVLCTRYKNLIKGVTELDLRDCEIRKRITISVSPPEGIMTTRDFQFELPDVRIKDAIFEAGNIIVTLDADGVIANVRIDIIDESDTILCSKYQELAKGVTDVELTDCEIRERITVSVSPPKTEMITGDFTLSLPEVRIRDIKSELGKLILSLEANMDISDVRIYVFGKGNEILCTKTESLAKGLSESELRGCPIQKEITVSVSSPKGKTTTRDFTQELPLLELKTGLKYTHLLISSDEKAYIDIYATKETDKEWEGIIGFRIEQNRTKKAKLIRFKIDKGNLDLLLSYLLGKDEILETQVQYTRIEELGGSDGAGMMILPFIMLAFKASGEFNLDELIEKGSTTTKDGTMADVGLSEPLMHKDFLSYEVTFYEQAGSPATPGGNSVSTQTEVVENKFFISVAKPYLLIGISGPNVPDYALEKVEAKPFELSEYDDYKIEVSEIQHSKSFCDADGVGQATVKNTGNKAIYTSDITVVQTYPSMAGVSVTWDKEVIQPGETAVFRDQCEGSGERNCNYQLTSPRGTKINIGMHCKE